MLTWKPECKPRWRDATELLDLCLVKFSVIMGQRRVDPFAALLKTISESNRQASIDGVRDKSNHFYCHITTAHVP